MKEPLNLKLLFFYLLKRIWVLVAAAVLFAFFFGGGYYLKNYVFAPAPDYVATSQLYLTYAEEVRLENVYINDYTWQTLAASDACVEEALKELTFDCTKEYLQNAATAGLESDVRLVTVTVTDKDPDKAVEIAHAYEKAIQKLGERMVDVDEVQIFTSADHAVKKEWDNRTVRMGITGAVIGFAASLMILLFVFSVDDSVYIPETTQIRYHIPTLACIDKNGNVIDKWEKEAGSRNLKAVLEGCGKVFFTDISEENGITEEQAGCLKELLPDSLKSVPVFVKSLAANPDAVDEMTQGDGVIVLLKAGNGNGKMIERSLSYLETQKIPVLGVILYDVNKAAVLSYRKPLRF